MPVRAERQVWQPDGPTCAKADRVDVELTGDARGIEETMSRDERLML